MQHFKFMNWRIRGFVFLCHEQVIGLLKVTYGQRLENDYVDGFLFEIWSDYFWQ